LKIQVKPTGKSVEESTVRMIAIIPARGGSKGIPGKNIAMLGGRPLIAWTILAAKAAPGFDRVIVSTDDEEIAAVARDFGAEVPFLRPAEFAGDAAPALGVIKHALSLVKAQDGQPYDAAAYLQPTSPFRTTAQIDAAVSLFALHGPDTLVSVTRTPHNMVPGSLMRRLPAADGLWLESPAGQTMRRQDKEVLFARNGPAILIVSARDILQHDRLYGEGVIGFEMDRLTSLDIDESLDLKMANCLLPLVASRG
jgi:CMP-N,N'-diacetyllegionaminic acid synthase